MAIRTIREMGDPVLTKRCKEVTNVNERLMMLVDDMIETMYDAEGVGLAAPQVGILKRVVVVDIYDDDPRAPFVLINPEIIETEGEQTDYEGCLSLPGKVGKVTRPLKVRVRAYDYDLKPFEVVGEGLLARAFLHEIDHLEGKMYVERVEGELLSSEELAAALDETCDDESGDD